MSNTNTAVVTVPATQFTLPIHFKRWEEGSKGHKDLLELASKGVIVDFEAEVEKDTNEEGKTVYKRKTLNFTVNTLACADLLATSGMTGAQVEHLQELVNAAIKKDIQAMVADTERTKPVTAEDLPTWETVLSQPFNKRPTAIKVTMDMVNAAVEALEAHLVENGVKEGGIKLTTGLCVKKFSLASLNAVDTPVIEKVQGLVLGWFESLGDAEQQVHFPVVDLWDKNIDAKLNPKQEEISIDMF